MNVSGHAFQASLFHPSLGNEVVDGAISLERGFLSFHSENFKETIPIERVVMELEKGGERVYFHDTARPELQLFTLDAAILESRSFGQCNRLREQLRAVLGRRELVRRLRLTLYFLIGCVFLAVLGSWVMGAAVRSLAGRVPAEWEQKLGEAQLKRMRTMQLLLEDTNAVSQLAALASPLVRLKPLGKHPVQFHIALDPEPNAFAIPGGHVIVNTGMLDMADNPEELLGVIAHELAHVTQKHHIRELISAAGPVLIFGVLLHSRDDLLNVLSAGAGVMVYKGFSQEYEREADDVGWSYLVASRIDPQGLIRVFRKFESYEAKQEGLALPQAFRSHPALDKRIARLEARYKKLAGKTNFVPLTNSVPKVEMTEKPREIFEASPE